MAAHEAVESHGPLEVDLIVRLQIAERAPGQRLWSEVERYPLTVDRYRGEAYPVHGEARAQVRSLAGGAGLDDEPRVAACDDPAPLLDYSREHVSSESRGARHLR